MVSAKAENGVIRNHSIMKEPSSARMGGGEMLLDQKAGGYDSRYKYTGKETDENTGLNYHGARYYNPSISMWYGVDPLAEKFPGWSPYNYVLNNPVRLIDPTGMSPEDNDWEPVVENNQLVVKKEEGDNAKTLAQFLNVDQKLADRLYSTASKDGTIKLTDEVPGVKQINESLKYDYPLFKIGNWTLNYNCWECATSIAEGETPNFSNIMDRFEFRDIVKSDYIDVTDTPSKYKFGHTLVRFAESNYSILNGTYSETTHAATYLGTSKNGTQYFWSKNGGHIAPGVFNLNSLQEKYGKIEGYRAEKGGGFYNLKY